MDQTKQAADISPKRVTFSDEIERIEPESLLSENQKTETNTPSKKEPKSILKKNHQIERNNEPETKNKPSIAENKTASPKQAIDLFEIKKNHSEHQLYQIAYKESFLELSASKEKLNAIEKKLRHVTLFDKWFRKNKIASLNQAKQHYQKKINSLQTLLHKQHKALDKKSIIQLKSTLQPQQTNSLSRSKKEHSR